MVGLRGEMVLADRVASGFSCSEDEGDVPEEVLEGEAAPLGEESEEDILISLLPGEMICRDPGCCLAVAVWSVSRCCLASSKG